MRRVLAVVVVLVPLVVITPVAAAPLSYRAPSDAPIVDRFRPPPERWMAGNRGIDFGTAPGAAIVAAADGRVVFADVVAGALHVTVSHADGLRTTYSFVASITVSTSDRVRAGDVIAVAAGPFHFGVRTPDGTYLDPEAVLAGRIRPPTRLVPGTDEGLPALTAERRSLLETVVGGGVAALASLGAGSADAQALLLHLWAELHPATHSFRVVDALRHRATTTCTAPTVAVPPPERRRIVVLVSGLGTSSESNTAMEIDTATLGYAPADVVSFSYVGGRAPRRQPVAVDPFVAIDERPFDALDSQQSLSESADRLSVLLAQVSAAEPEVPIDVLAHSQGGVVARLAISRSADAGRLPDEVRTLVTVASPQQGAPLATAVDALGLTPGGRATLARLRPTMDDLDDRLPAIGDLSETSTTMAELRARTVPDPVRFVTIGASGDVVVPATAALDPAADAMTVVPTPVGRAAHGSMPSTAAATREIGLAVAGMAPTCRSWGSVLMGAMTAEAIRWTESALAAIALGSSVATPVLPVD